MRTVKKINMKSATAFLSAKEMKRILGGGGGEGGYGGSGESGTCGYAAWTGDSWAIECNISKTLALQQFNHFTNTTQRWWCCDSCSSTAYCG